MPKGIVNRCLFSRKEVQPSRKNLYLYQLVFHVTQKLIKFEQKMIFYVCSMGPKFMWHKSDSNLNGNWFFTCPALVLCSWDTKGTQIWMEIDFLLAQYGSYVHVTQKWLKFESKLIFTCPPWVLCSCDTKVTLIWIKIDFLCVQHGS